MIGGDDNGVWYEDGAKEEEGKEMNEACPCGNPALDDDHLCARCRYYQTVFNPPRQMFESKIERAQRAIRVRKEMRKSVRMVEVE